MASWPKLLYTARAVPDPEDLDGWMELAIKEIKKTYGVDVSIATKAKSLRKFGQNESVGTTEATIMELAGSEVAETYATTNSIDSLICTDANFDGLMYVEGHTISNGLLTFKSQLVQANGQTRAPLTTPLARASRLECADETTFTTPATDKVYVYEDSSVSGGVPQTASKVHLMISGFERQSKKLSTAFSQFDYFLLSDLYIDINKKTTALCDVRLKVRELGEGQGRLPGGFKTKVIRTINTAALSTLDMEFRPFRIVPANSDAIVTALASTTGVSISGGFNGILAGVV